MPSYAALLRGVNVGKAKRIAMADLRRLVEELGYGRVRTLLNSGNVVLDADGEEPARIAARIEAALAAAAGIKARVFVFPADELAAAIAQNPFADIDVDPARLLIAFVGDAGGLERLRVLEATDWTPERIAVTGQAAYLLCPDGISAGRLAEVAFKALGDAGTTRNLATAMKLLDLAGR
ncbi:DUF1697 domain-containing protein [Indioceanicola profundi]|uniref:DUF1697 domain-containing protein n=1 Tax=Indioceanicola profundi TaxID=2220096 RepID=UPI000E6AD6F1|nr:DUF1697 domain-containing protein [Indioceanicola profundi]